MKKPLSAALLLVASSPLFAASILEGEDGWNLSYSLGFQAGLALESQLQREGINLDKKAFLQGITDRIGATEPAITTDKMEGLLKAFQLELVTRLQQVAEANAEKGQKFLTGNATAAGVNQLASGLQYKVMAPGDGPQPKASDTVSVHYRGSLIDGTEFDSSYRRGEPVSFRVSEVIPAWQEALPQMKTGAKWQLFVPPQLAYGSRGTGKVIGPNETLIFEVELLEIK